jgi:ABC-type antimicrobial peptide transport system permease subunit
VDPALEVDQFVTLGSLMRRINAAQYYTAGSLGAMATIMIFLSAAGIHALMSVVLSQRRREIGVGVALGATPSRLLPDIFGHAALRLAAGAAGGILLALLLRSVAAEELADARLPGVIPSAAAVMIAAGLVAALGPVRRALRVDPNATLRND